MILERLEHMEAKLPLDVVGLGVKLFSKVCSGHWLRPEGTHAIGQAGVLHPWILGS